MQALLCCARHTDLHSADATMKKIHPLALSLELLLALRENLEEDGMEFLLLRVASSNGWLAFSCCSSLGSAASRYPDVDNGPGSNLLLSKQLGKVNHNEKNDTDQQ